MSKLGQNRNNLKQFSKRISGADTNPFGQLAPGAVTTDRLADAAVAEAKLSGAVAAKLNLSREDLHIGLEFDGGRGDVSTDTLFALGKLINLGLKPNSAAYGSLGLDTSCFDSTNKKFGTYSMKLKGGQCSFPAMHGTPAQGTLSVWYRNVAANGAIACNPALGLSLFLDAAGHLNAQMTEATALTQSTKVVRTVDGGINRASDLAFNNAIVRWRGNSMLGAGTDLLHLLHNGQDEGTQLNALTTRLGVDSAGDGGFWFPGSKINNPAWTSYSAFLVLPSAEASPWTWTGAAEGSVASVSGGRLTLDTFDVGGAIQGNYSKTGATTLAGVDLSSMTAEWKMRTLPGTGANSNTCNRRLSLLGDDRNTVLFRDDSLNRAIVFNFSNRCVTIVQESSSRLHEVDIYLDTTKMHVYRFTATGSPSPIVKFYIDGNHVHSFTLSVNETTVNDVVRFGDNLLASENSKSEWEYFAYATGVSAPLSESRADDNGNIDSFGVTQTVATADVVGLLQLSPVTEVYRNVPWYGPTLPPRIMLQRDVLITRAGPAGAWGPSYNMLGDGITEYRVTLSTAVAMSAAGWANMLIEVSDNTGVNGEFGSLTLAQQTSADGGAITEWVAATLNTDYQMTASRTIVLPVGVWICQPTLGTDPGGSTASIQPTDMGVTWFERAIVKTGRL